jgi:hypothetical protein
VRNPEASGSGDIVNFREVQEVAESARTYVERYKTIMTRLVELGAWSALEPASSLVTELERLVIICHDPTPISASPRYDHASG